MMNHIFLDNPSKRAERSFFRLASLEKTLLWAERSLTLSLTSLFSLLVGAETCFRAGPYLQELTPTSVCVVYENTLPTFSWVEVRTAGTASTTRYYSDSLGKHKIYNQISAPQPSLPLQNFCVPVEGLLPGNAYEYRVCSQKIDEMRPYSAKIGTQYNSEWYTFATPPADATEHRLAILSDMHHQPELLAQFLHALDYESADAFIFAGDMMDNMQSSAARTKGKEEPYESFVNTCVNLFATQKPFYMVRGECETQGDISRFFSRYFPHQSGRLYNAYRWGDLEIVLLDGGAALPDSDPQAHFSTLSLFSSYREEEALWFENLIQTEEFCSAKYHIVVSHFPIPYTVQDEDAEGGIAQFQSLMLPLLNRAGIDLFISGHLHPETFSLMTAESGGANYPLLVQGAHTAARLDIQNGRIELRIVDKEGKELHKSFMN